MSNEENSIILSHLVEEDKDTDNVVRDVFVAESCSAKCPTCQQTCEYTAGHSGLHHCEKGHEWI